MYVFLNYCPAPFSGGPKCENQTVTEEFSELRISEAGSEDGMQSDVEDTARAYGRMSLSPTHPEPQPTPSRRPKALELHDGRYTRIYRGSTKELLDHCENSVLENMATGVATARITHYAEKKRNFENTGIVKWQASQNISK